MAKEKVNEKTCDCENTLEYRVGENFLCLLGLSAIVFILTMCVVGVEDTFFKKVGPIHITESISNERMIEWLGDEGFEFTTPDGHSLFINGQDSTWQAMLDDSGEVVFKIYGPNKMASFNIPGIIHNMEGPITILGR